MAIDAGRSRRAERSGVGRVPIRCRSLLRQRRPLRGRRTRSPRWRPDTRALVGDRCRRHHQHRLLGGRGAAELLRGPGARGHRAPPRPCGGVAARRSPAPPRDRRDRHRPCLRHAARSARCHTRAARSRRAPAERPSVNVSCRYLLTLAAFLPAAMLATTVHGEEQTPAPTAPPSTTAQQLAKEALNPFSQYIKVPLQSVTGFRVGPRNNTGESVCIEPVIPFSFGSDWSIIVQPLLAVEYLPGPNATTGLQDMQMSVFLTPEMTSSWIWGVGPIVEGPTATNSQLGTGKWSAGPTGAVIYSNGPWLNGVLVSELVSFAGNQRRSNVNLTSIETQVSYTFADGWYVQNNPTFSYDWTGAAWTVPIGADVGKALTVGEQAISLQAGAYDLVKRPEGDPAWIIRVSVTLLFPTGER